MVQLVAYSNSCQTSQCEPRMVLKRLLRTVAVVVRQLDAFREIIFRYQNEMRTIANHHGLRH